MAQIAPTPIEYYGRIGEAEVYIKRDDRIPFSFGGNKVRIAEEVFAEAKAKGAKRVISYGSASSNLNRVMVHMAAREGLACTVIIKKENCGGEHPTFNEIMVLDSGAEILYTEPENVRETVAETLARYEALGEAPYYIYGDETGKGGEEVLARAYRKAAEEIREQEKELGIHFDTLALPVGTGATISGLAESAEEKTDNTEDGAKKSTEEGTGENTADCTKKSVEEDVKILGISVARSKEKVLESLTEAARAKDPEILDTYRMGGYGKYTPELVEFIRENLRGHGLPLDPCYSGKAFYGLTEEIRKGNVKGNVLFIHTGGLPLFFDLMEQL